MGKKKVFLALVSSLVLLFSMSPATVLATSDAQLLSFGESPALVLADSDAQLLSMESTSNPVCLHERDVPHSSMRLIRVTTRFNYMEQKEETLSWYQCVLCGYERPWIEPD